MEKENAALADEIKVLEDASAQKNNQEQGEESETSQEVDWLLNVTNALNPSDGYEEKFAETMSLRGRSFSKGFIMHYWGGGEGVEFYLGGKYKTMSFKLGHLDDSDKSSIFTLHYTLDGTPQESISMKSEDPVQEKTIDLNNADYIKFSWDNDKGYSEYGMADITVQ